MIPSHIQSLLDRLHAESSAQERGVPYDEARALFRTHTSTSSMAQIDAMFLDKFIALDQDKAEFVHHLLLAQGATTVVEAGTSFGVSTIYLALAASESAKRKNDQTDDAAAERKPIVVATEKEESKVDKAREIWAACGDQATDAIDLRVGDLNETLKDLRLPEGRYVDALLLDIWTYVALPALELVMPKMRPGSVVVTDNTISSAEGYKDLLAVLRNPEGPFTSITLPYKNGLELSVYMP